MNRKEAIREYKERKTEKGIFSIRCNATGRQWIESSPNLGAARNGAFFTLRAGGHRDKALQAEFTANGEPAFEFEVLETLPDDVPQLNLRDLLKERKLHWVAERNAAPMRNE